MGRGRLVPPHHIPHLVATPSPPLWYCGGPVVFPAAAALLLSCCAAAVAASVPPPPLWCCGLWFVLNFIDFYCAPEFH